jgi:hypothetical protein
VNIDRNRLERAFLGLPTLGHSADRSRFTTHQPMMTRFRPHCRYWRVVVLRNKGEILGQFEAHDVASAKAAAAIQFDLDEIQRNRIMVQELA